MKLLWQFQSIDISTLLRDNPEDIFWQLVNAPLFFTPRFVRSFPRSFELPRARFPSVTYPLPSRLPSPVSRGGLSNSPISLSWILIQNRKRVAAPRSDSLLAPALSSSPTQSQPEPRRQICRVKSQMNTHSATEGNQRSTGHAGNWQL